MYEGILLAYSEFWVCLCAVLSVRAKRWTRWTEPEEDLHIHHRHHQLPLFTVCDELLSPKSGITAVCRISDIPPSHHRFIIAHKLCSWIQGFFKENFHHFLVVFIYLLFLKLLLKIKFLLFFFLNCIIDGVVDYCTTHPISPIISVVFPVFSCAKVAF